MEKVLYKKSYQLNSFAPKRYDDLLGKRGIFSTIRVLGKKPKFILIDYHMSIITHQEKEKCEKFILSCDYKKINTEAEGYAFYKLL